MGRYATRRLMLRLGIVAIVRIVPNIIGSLCCIRRRRKRTKEHNIDEDTMFAITPWHVHVPRTEANQELQHHSGYTSHPASEATRLGSSNAYSGPSASTYAYSGPSNSASSTNYNAYPAPTSFAPTSAVPIRFPHVPNRPWVYTHEDPPPYISEE